VDRLYDAVDQVVAEMSKEMYQRQLTILQAFDLQIAKMRQEVVQAAQIENSLDEFEGRLQQALSLISGPEDPNETPIDQELKS